MYSILLYYKFTPISDPTRLRDEQYELCARLGLRGRILIAEEGINGTVGGTAEAVAAYREATAAIPDFSDIDWKESTSEHDPFPRLRVTVRPEIVTLGVPVDLSKKAPYITPAALRELVDNPTEEVYFIDGRNEYEYRIGRFKDALHFDTDNFYELPEQLEKLEHLKKKKVVTYCTGGIRCEKASALLREHGFENVYQLAGGIHRYGDYAGGKDFEGLMYVFDSRIAIPINSVNPEVVGKCHHCAEKTERFINCKNKLCNEQILCCEQCGAHFADTCSTECHEKISALVVA